VRARREADEDDRRTRVRARDVLHCEVELAPLAIVEPPVVERARAPAEQVARLAERRGWVGGWVEDVESASGARRVASPSHRLPRLRATTVAPARPGGGATVMVYNSEPRPRLFG
jgi:hypothetical protein